MIDNDLAELKAEINALRTQVAETNRLVEKIHNAQVMGRVFRVIYWLVIIAATLIALYYLKPALSNLTSIYTGGLSGLVEEGTNSSTSPNNSTSQDELLQLIDFYNSQLN